MKFNRHPWIVLSTVFSLIVPQAGNALVTTADDSLNVDCSSYCSIYKKTAYGTFFQNFKSFNDTENQLCADLGKPTTTNYSNAKTPAVIPTGRPTYPSTLSCSAGSFTVTQPMYDLLYSSNRLTDAVYADPTSACTFLGHAQELCQNYNSSAANYCLAYNAITGDDGGDGNKKAKCVIAWDSILASLDAAIAIGCGVACVIPTPNNVLACSIGAMAEGAHEIIATSVQMSSKLNKEINDASSKIEDLGEASLVSIGGTATGVATMIANRAAEKAANAAGTAAGREVGKKSAEKILSCASAVFYTTLFGIRVADAVMIGKARDEACKSAKEHLSNSKTTTSATSSTSSSTTTGGSNPGSGGNRTSSTGGGSTGGTLSGGSLVNDPLGGCANPATCFAAGAQAGGMSGADANSLRGADLNGVLANVPNPRKLMQDAFQSGAGAALSKIMPAEAGAFGASLPQIAKAAQADADKLGKAVGVQSSASTGAYQSGSTAPKATNPAAPAKRGGFLGNHLGQGKAPANVGIQVFQEHLNQQPTDIWHANSEINLFQIVSQKLNDMSDRMDPSEGVEQ